MTTSDVIDINQKIDAIIEYREIERKLRVQINELLTKQLKEILPDSTDYEVSVEPDGIGIWINLPIPLQGLGQVGCIINTEERGIQGIIDSQGNSILLNYTWK